MYTNAHVPVTKKERKMLSKNSSITDFVNTVSKNSGNSSDISIAWLLGTLFGMATDEQMLRLIERIEGLEQA